MKFIGIILSRQRTTKALIRLRIPRRLICAFVVRIRHKTDFLMTRLIWQYKLCVINSPREKFSNIVLCYFIKTVILNEIMDLIDYRLGFTVCFPHIFLLYIRNTYRGNWKTYVEFVPHVLFTSNRACSIPYVFFLFFFLFCFFSIRFIQSENRSWRLIAFADSTGAWEYTKSLCYQSAIITKGLINCLSLNNE